MTIQLTPEQEQRIQAIVDAGAYPSAEEAIDAALAAVETVAVASGFDGTEEEVEELLLQGLNSGGAVVANEAYWDRLRANTDAMAREYLAQKAPLR